MSLDESQNRSSARGESNVQSPVTGSNKKDPFLGTMISDRYRVIQIVGKGGMGVVYKARHEMLDRLVAIKMLHPQLVCDEVSVARFRREAKAACRLTHPNIVSLHDFGRLDNDIHYLVMDYLEGQSLSEAIKKDGQISVARCINIFVQVCDALEHAHRERVVHRDMKPGNIMLINRHDDPDFVQVVDFGVAKMCGNTDDSEVEDSLQRLTQTGEVFGSPVYMSPEQCMGNQLGPQSDIYAVGIVMYEALTGRPPLMGRNVVETITKHMQIAPPPFSEVRPDLYIPERLEQAIMRALQKKSENRQQSMEELKQDLLRAHPNPRSSALRNISSSLESGIQPAVNTTARQPKQQNTFIPWLIAGFAVLFALVAGAICLTTLFRPASSPTSHKSTTNPPVHVQPQTKTTPPANTKTTAATTKTTVPSTDGTTSVPQTAVTVPAVKPSTPPRVSTVPVRNIKPPRTVPTYVETPVRSHHHTNIETYQLPPVHHSSRTHSPSDPWERFKHKHEPAYGNPPSNFPGIPSGGPGSD